MMSPDAQSPVRSSAHYNLRKLHSLSGLVPIGAFLCEHFFTNSFSMMGAAEYNAKCAFLSGLPYVFLLEIGLIFLPILFHGVLGMVIAFESKTNVAGYPTARNWAYFFQRLSGVFLLFYITYHVVTTRFAGTQDMFALMERNLHDPAIFAFYVLGVVSASYHFGNGLWGFCVTWGITVGPRSQRMMAYASVGVTLVFALAGVNSLLGFLGSPITAFQH